MVEDVSCGWEVDEGNVRSKKLCHRQRVEGRPLVGVGRLSSAEKLEDVGGGVKCGSERSALLRLVASFFIQKLRSEG